MRFDIVRMDQPLSLVLFSRQFAALIEAGVSLVRALDVLAQDAPPPYDAAAKAVRLEIEEGSTLSQAMAARPQLFSAFYTRMVRMGEIGGVLEDFLGYLADLLEDTYRITRHGGRRLGAAWMFYPTNRLPEEDWSWLNDRHRAFVLMLFCRSLGVTLSSGVPAALALEAAAELLPIAQRDAVRAVARDGVAPGLSARLAALGFLPSLVTELMAVGEEYGAFDHAMIQAADVYRQELQCRLT